MKEDGLIFWCRLGRRIRKEKVMSRASGNLYARRRRKSKARNIAHSFWSFGVLPHTF